MKKEILIMNNKRSSAVCTNKITAYKYRLIVGVQGIRLQRTEISTNLWKSPWLILTVQTRVCVYTTTFRIRGRSNLEKMSHFKFL